MNDANLKMLLLNYCWLSTRRWICRFWPYIYYNGKWNDWNRDKCRYLL